MRFAAIGLDHRHIYDLTEGLLDAGATCAAYWPQTTDPRVLEGFRKRFPAVPAVDDRDALMRDPSIDAIVSARGTARPRLNRDRGNAQRQGRAGRQAGRDRARGTRRGPARGAGDWPHLLHLLLGAADHAGSEVAAKLVADGAIGRVIQTVGLGPHRFNRAIRPAWFRSETGWRHLANIASHKIEQFLFYTGSQTAEIVHSAIGKFGTEDFRSSKTSARSCCAATVRAATCASTGSRPTGCPRGATGASRSSARMATSSCARTSTSRGAPAPSTCSWRTMWACATSKSKNEPVSDFRRFIADVRDRTETAMTESTCSPCAASRSRRRCAPTTRCRGRCGRSHQSSRNRADQRACSARARGGSADQCVAGAQQWPFYRSLAHLYGSLAGIGALARRRDAGADAAS